MRKLGYRLRKQNCKTPQWLLLRWVIPKKMTDVTLFNVKDGQYLIGERNPVLNRVSMDMQTAAYIPIEESLAKVQEATQRFEYEEQQRQYAQSQAQG